MAVAHFVRALQIFSGSGTIAVVPFAVQFANRQSEINLSGGRRLMSDDSRQEPTQPQEKPVSTAEAVLKEAAKRLEGEGNEVGKTGCFWLSRSSLELFMCVDTKKLTPLVLFHFAFREKHKPLSERLNEVTEVIYSNSSDIKMKFKDGKYVSIPRYLTSSFAWLRGWGKSMVPRRHCSLEDKADGSKQHKLTCKKADKSKVWSDGVKPEVTESKEAKLKIG